MQETWVQSLGQEDALEKEMATHSSILAMENFMDRGAWQATIHGDVKNQIQLSNQHFHFTFPICKMGISTPTSEAVPRVMGGVRCWSQS